MLSGFTDSLSHCCKPIYFHVVLNFHRIENERLPPERVFQRWILFHAVTCYVKMSWHTACKDDPTLQYSADLINQCQPYALASFDPLIFPFSSL